MAKYAMTLEDSTLPWSSGTFSRIFGASGWTDDKNNAIKILSSRHDTHDQDLADGINACITRDNQAKPTASFLPATDNTINLGSGSFRWAALNGISVSDFARQSQANAFAGNQNSAFLQSNTNSSTGTLANARFTLANSADQFVAVITSTGYSGSFLTGGPSGESANLYTSANVPISIGTSNTERIRVAGDGSTINLQATSVQVNSKPIAAVGAFKAASTARASNTTFSDDPDLVLSSLPAGTYEIEVGLFFNATTGGAGGIKFQLAFSGSVTNGTVINITHSGVTVLSENTFGGGVITLFSLASISVAATIDSALCKATVTLGGTNNVSVQWAQNSSSVNAANLLLMSRLVARRIA